MAFAKQEYPLLDLGKMVAALMVVSIHTQLFIGGGKEVLIHEVFNNIPVPFFFVASAFFLFQKSRREAEYTALRKAAIGTLCFLVHCRTSDYLPTFFH